MLTFPSASAGLKENKKVVTAFYDLAFNQHKPKQAAERYLVESYIQHNPNVVSGAAALEEFIRNSRPERPIEDRIALPLTAIIAERDMVTFVFVRQEKDEAGDTYYTSWFDVFRVENGLIVEHWDPAMKSAEMLKLDPNKKRIDP